MFVIYGTPDCEWCNRAKELLDKESYSYTYIDLTEDLDGQKMFKSRGLRTVPQIFYQKDSLIGGYEDLKHFLDNIQPDFVWPTIAEFKK